MERLTDLQVQAALILLGYDPGVTDGIFGPRTQAALDNFSQDYGLTQQDPEVVRGSLVAAIARQIDRVTPEPEPEQDPEPEASTSSGAFAGIEHFRPEEFACKCSGLCNKDTATMDHNLLLIDEKIRAHFGGRPVVITSGIRCPQHNANVGGVANSRHLTGHANDLVVSGFSASMVLAYAQTLPGVNYAYAIDSSAVHIDTI